MISICINGNYNLVSAVGISQTSQTASSGTSGTSGASNVSRNSQFSASSGDDVFPSGQILPTPNLRIFSFAELKASTRNFKSDTLLGEGGFGKVFKGWLDEKVPGKTGSGTVVAVKKLNSESLQGYEEWQVTQLNFLQFCQCFALSISSTFIYWYIRYVCTCCEQEIVMDSRNTLLTN